jgi:hypothetical protein
MVSSCSVHIARTSASPKVTAAYYDTNLHTGIYTFFDWFTYFNNFVEINACFLIACK